MSKEDDKTERQKDSFSDSDELFENIFRQAISETEKPKAGKPNVEETRRAIAVRPKAQSQPKKKAPVIVHKPAKQTQTAPPEPEKVKPDATTVGKSTPSTAKTKSGRESSRLRMAIFIVLLVVLAGVLVRFFGVLDLSSITGFLGLEQKKIAHAPQKKVTRTLPEKPIAAPPEKQVQQEVLLANRNEIKALPPQMIVQASPVEPKKVERSASDKLKKEVAGLEIPAPSAETQQKEGVVSKETLSFPQGRPKPMEDLDKGVTHPLTVEAQPPAKPTGKEIAYPQLIKEQHRYSIYLGSYKTSTQVEKAMSIFQEKGLSPYWARVDLGTKGIWFRLFAGYFPTKETAESYIRKNQIAGAEPGYTKYANFLGSYRSEKDLEAQKAKLISLGFCPYTIKGADGGMLLYSGAFDRVEFAKKNQRDLTSKGILNELVER
jgi:cell division septation protein DedD